MAKAKAATTDEGGDQLESDSGDYDGDRDACLGYCPSPEQIRAECEAIRAGWRERDYWIRSGHPDGPPHWRPPGTDRTPKVHGDEAALREFWRRRKREMERERQERQQQGQQQQQQQTLECQRE